MGRVRFIALDLLERDNKNGGPPPSAQLIDLSTKSNTENSSGEICILFEEQVDLMNEKKEEKCCGVEDAVDCESRQWIDEKSGAEMCHQEEWPTEIAENSLMKSGIDIQPSATKDSPPHCLPEVINDYSVKFPVCSPSAFIFPTSI
jgi:hypothetical protein